MNLLCMRYVAYLFASLCLLVITLFLNVQSLNLSQVGQASMAFCAGVLLQTFAIPKLPMFNKILQPDTLNPSTLVGSSTRGMSLHAGAALATLFCALVIGFLWWVLGFEVQLMLIFISSMSSGLLFFYHTK